MSTSGGALSLASREHSKDSGQARPSVLKEIQHTPPSPHPRPRTANPRLTSTSQNPQPLTVKQPKSDPGPRSRLRRKGNANTESIINGEKGPFRSVSFDDADEFSMRPDRILDAMNWPAGEAHLLDPNEVPKIQNYTKHNLIEQNVKKTKEIVLLRKYLSTHVVNLEERRAALEQENTRLENSLLQERATSQSKNHYVSRAEAALTDAGTREQQLKQDKAQKEGEKQDLQQDTSGQEYESAGIRRVNMGLAQKLTRFQQEKRGYQAYIKKLQDELVEREMSEYHLEFQYNNAKAANKKVEQDYETLWRNYITVAEFLWNARDHIIVSARVLEDAGRENVFEVLQWTREERLPSWFNSVPSSGSASGQYIRNPGSLGHPASPDNMPDLEPSPSASTGIQQPGAPDGLSPLPLTSSLQEQAGNIYIPPAAFSHLPSEIGAIHVRKPSTPTEVFSNSPYVKIEHKSSPADNYEEADILSPVTYKGPESPPQTDARDDRDSFPQSDDIFSSKPPPETSRHFRTPSPPQSTSNSTDPGDRYCDSAEESSSKPNVSRTSPKAAEMQLLSRSLPQVDLESRMAFDSEGVVSQQSANSYPSWAQDAIKHHEERASLLVTKMPRHQASPAQRTPLSSHGAPRVPSPFSKGGRSPSKIPRRSKVLGSLFLSPVHATFSFDEEETAESPELAAALSSESTSKNDTVEEKVKETKPKSLDDPLNSIVVATDPRRCEMPPKSFKNAERTALFEQLMNSARAVPLPETEPHTPLTSEALNSLGRSPVSPTNHVGRWQRTFSPVIINKELTTDLKYWSPTLSEIQEMAIEHSNALAFDDQSKLKYIHIGIRPLKSNISNSGCDGSTLVSSKIMREKLDFLITSSPRTSPKESGYDSSGKRSDGSLPEVFTFEMDEQLIESPSQAELSPTSPQSISPAASKSPSPSQPRSATTDSALIRLDDLTEKIHNAHVATTILPDVFHRGARQQQSDKKLLESANLKEENEVKQELNERMFRHVAVQPEQLPEFETTRFTLKPIGVLTVQSTPPEAVADRLTNEPGFVPPKQVASLSASLSGVPARQRSSSGSFQHPWIEFETPAGVSRLVPTAKHAKAHSADLPGSILKAQQIASRRQAIASLPQAKAKRPLHLKHVETRLNNVSPKEEPKCAETVKMEAERLNKKLKKQPDEIITGDPNKSQLNRTSAARTEDESPQMAEYLPKSLSASESSSRVTDDSRPGGVVVSNRGSVLSKSSRRFAGVITSPRGQTAPGYVKSSYASFDGTSEIPSSPESNPESEVSSAPGFTQIPLRDLFVPRPISWERAHREKAKARALQDGAAHRTANVPENVAYMPVEFSQPVNLPAVNTGLSFRHSHLANPRRKEHELNKSIATLNGTTPPITPTSIKGRPPPDTPARMLLHLCAELKDVVDNMKVQTSEANSKTSSPFLPHSPSLEVPRLRLMMMEKTVPSLDLMEKKVNRMSDVLRQLNDQDDWFTLSNGAIRAQSTSENTRFTFSSPSYRRPATSERPRLTGKDFYWGLDGCPPGNERASSRYLRGKNKRRSNSTHEITGKKNMTITAEVDVDQDTYKEIFDHLVQEIPAGGSWIERWVDGMLNARSNGTKNRSMPSFFNDIISARNIDLDELGSPRELYRATRGSSKQSARSVRTIPMTISSGTNSLMPSLLSFGEGVARNQLDNSIWQSFSSPPICPDEQAARAHKQLTPFYQDSSPRRKLRYRDKPNPLLILKKFLRPKLTSDGGPRRHNPIRRPAARSRSSRVHFAELPDRRGKLPALPWLEHLYSRHELAVPEASLSTSVDEGHIVNRVAEDHEVDISDMSINPMPAPDDGPGPNLEDELQEMSVSATLFGKSHGPEDDDKNQDSKTVHALVENLIKYRAREQSMTTGTQTNEWRLRRLPSIDAGQRRSDIQTQTSPFAQAVPMLPLVAKPNSNVKPPYITTSAQTRGTPKALPVIDKPLPMPPQNIFVFIIQYIWIQLITFWLTVTATFSSTVGPINNNIPRHWSGLPRWSDVSGAKINFRDCWPYIYWLFLFLLLLEAWSERQEWKNGNVSTQKYNQVMSWREDIFGFDLLEWLRYELTMYFNLNEGLSV